MTVTGTAFGAAFPLVNAPGMAALPTDVTLYVRVGSRVDGNWRYSASIPFTAASQAP